MSQRLIIGPFNRVEGDLEVQLDIADGRVTQARVNATMYRGFEQMLAGRAPLDALVIVPRICGICSVSQSVAAARAISDASGVTVPPNGVHTINLMLACENLADHLSHFYLFFMPDFARPVYSQRPWFAEATRRFTAMAGEHARAPVAARQRGFEIMGTLGGKWPHTLSIQPGGSARAVEAAERIRLLAKVREFRAFLEATTFGAPLEEIAALDSEAALQRWHAADPLRGDLRLFLTLAADLKLDTLGRGPGRTLSFGAYRQPDGSHALAEGVWSESLGRLQPVDTGAIREDATHAWLAGDEALHPSEGLTAPMIDKPGGYTWNKAPWLSGEVVETGAIARQLASGQPLIRDAVARCRANVYTRVLARLVELARVLQMTEQWLTALAPRDTVGAPGALEAALEGTAVQPGEDTPVAVQHIVRSFDPCMVCTVH